MFIFLMVLLSTLSFFSLCIAKPKFSLIVIASLFVLPRLFFIFLPVLQLIGASAS